MPAASQLVINSFDLSIVHFFGIVAVGGRRELRHCWKGILTLLLPLIEKGNFMMLLDGDWKGRRSEGMQLLEGDWKGC